MKIYLVDGTKVPFKLSFVWLLLSVAAAPRSARANAPFQVLFPWSCVQADIRRFNAPIADLQSSPSDSRLTNPINIASLSPVFHHLDQGGAFSSNPTRASSVLRFLLRTRGSLPVLSWFSCSA